MCNAPKLETCFSEYGLARMARWWYNLPTFVSGLVIPKACNIGPNLVLLLGNGHAPYLSKSFRSTEASIVEGVKTELKLMG